MAFLLSFLMSKTLLYFGHEINVEATLTSLIVSSIAALSVPPLSVSAVPPSTDLTVPSSSTPTVPSSSTPTVPSSALTGWGRGLHAPSVHQCKLCI
nr:uncharacterized protein LOC105850630 isoform X8 [Hydra vulgaris]XP_047130634.1 uncharacterized protein LOC105850630 isoform X9 [Hydra vulgaris]